MLEMMIDNKNGNVWDVSEIAYDVSWSTVRAGRPASVDFSLLTNAIYQDITFTINNGDIIRVKQDDKNVFYGYVFSIKENRDGEVSIKAYDQLRYLLAKDTYVFKNIKLGDIIQRIAADFRLKVGSLADTKYSIPSMVEDGQTLLDIIEKANTLTLANSNRHHVFYDDFGVLALRYVNDWVADFYIGDESLMTDYDYSRDIDTDTYNKIKLYKDNKTSGKRDIYQVQDSANMAKWGVLQLYQSIDDDKNEAQIKQLLEQLTALKNREAKSLKISAIGVPGIRAGMYMPIIIEDLGIRQPMLIDEAVHKFDGEDHTMSLTMKVI